MTRRRIALVAIWLLPLLITPVLADAEVYPGWIIPEVLNVRSGRGEDRRIIGSVRRGDKVHVTAFVDGWCWAKLPDGTWGWLREKFIQFSAAEGRQLAGSAGTSSSPNTGGSGTATNSGSPAWVKVSNANVRAGPGLDYPSYGTRPAGTKVFVIGRQGDWAKVKTPGGAGWVLASLLTDDVPTGQRLAAALEQGQSGTPKQEGTAKAFIDGEVVFLRSGPGTRYDYRARLRKGQTLYVYQKQGDWVKARVHGGHEGWIHNSLVKYAGNGGGSTAGAGSAVSPPVIPGFPSPTREYEGGFELSERPAWVDENGARVRYGPGFDHDVKAVLDRGAQVTVTDLGGHWCKVRLPNGSYGWMAGWVLDFDGPGDDIVADEGGQPVEVKVGWIARPRINLRGGPSESHEIVGKATLSTKVVILEQSGDWYRIGLPGGREAWAASWLIDTREQRQVRAARKSSVTGSGAPSAAVAGYSLAGGDDLGSQIVAEAVALKGSGYSYGCSGEGGRFDCSGFTSYLYRQHGISISRSVVAQYRQGIPVSRSELQPGDCVFFRNTHRSGISHVGIYKGDGMFVHASNPRSGVKEDALDSSYYGPRYAGARRMR